MLKEDMMRIFNEEFKSQIEHARNLAFQEAKRETAKSVLEMFDSGKSPEEIKAYLKTNFIK